MKRIFILSLFALCLFSLYSCYEKKHGCLDVYATNYDFDADVVCEEECCIYPSLKLEIEHKFGSLNFALRDTFINNVGDSFIVLNQKFFLSGISLFTDRDKVIFKQSEVIPLKNKSEVTIEKNYKLVKELITSITVNQFKSIDSIHRLKIDIGLNNFFKEVDFASVPTGSELATSSGMIDTIGNYYNYLATIVRGENLSDTISIFATSYYEKEFSFTLPLKQSPGVDLILPIKLDYYNLFKNVRLKLGSKDEINGLLNQNLAFFIE